MTQNPFDIFKLMRLLGDGAGQSADLFGQPNQAGSPQDAMTQALIAGLKNPAGQQDPMQLAAAAQTAPPQDKSFGSLYEQFKNMISGSGPVEAKPEQRPGLDVYNKDGSITRQDGTVVLPNGDIKLPDGTIVKKQVAVPRK